jgi:hypothetical protein
VFVRDEKPSLSPPGPANKSITGIATDVTRFLFRACSLDAYFFNVRLGHRADEMIIQALIVIDAIRRQIRPATLLDRAS